MPLSHMASSRGASSASGMPTRTARPASGMGFTGMREASSASSGV